MLIGLVISTENTIFLKCFSIIFLKFQNWFLMNISWSISSFHTHLIKRCHIFREQWGRCMFAGIEASIHDFIYCVLSQLLQRLPILRRNVQYASNQLRIKSLWRVGYNRRKQGKANPMMLCYSSWKCCFPPLTSLTMS